jgi:small-conductance mechanosensitive channel
MGALNTSALENNGELLESTKVAEEINDSVFNFLSHLDPFKILHFVIALIGFFIVYRLTVFIFNKAYDYLEGIKNRNFFELKFKNLTLVSDENINQVLDICFKIIKSVFFIFFIYSFLTYALNIFESTKNISSKLLTYFVYSISFIFKAIWSFAPNILVIFSIILVTYFILEFAKIIVRALYLQQIVFRGFKREWIKPTYQILRFFIIVFAVIMIFPYLPGSESEAFKGISVFLGILLSLGSSSAIANIVAGVVLIYMSPFGLKDRVRIGDIVGDIEDMGLLVTRIKTIKNEDITIPNSIILGKEVVNYSTSAESNEKLIISIPIGLGYDVELETVDQLLLGSCDIKDNILCDPPPFVLVKELSDYCINYELCAYVNDASKILLAKSELQRNIIQNFKKSGVEILSPAHVDIKNKA